MITIIKTRAMGPTTALFLAGLTPACMTASGTGQSWKVASVGTDITGLSVTAAGIQAASINQSVAFGKVADTIKGMWTNYLMAEGLKFIAGKYYGHEGKIVDQSTTLELEKLRNAKSVTDADAALKAAKQAAEIEAAASAIPVT